MRNGETGLLTAHTPEALAAAVLTLIDDPARALTMGSAGQRDVLERFNYERQLDRIVESFRLTAARQKIKVGPPDKRMKTLRFSIQAL